MALVEFDLSRTYRMPRRNMHDSVWTKERVEILNKGWQAGNTATILSLALGVSRNAVLGKLHRIGATKRTSGRKAGQRFLPAEIKGRAERIRIPKIDLPLRAKTKKGKQSAVDRARRLILAEEMRKRLSHIEIVDLSAQQLKVAVSLMKLDSHTCRWPLGHQAEDKPLMFCGSEPFLDHPYCHSHCQMAYERVARG